MNKIYYFIMLVASVVGLCACDDDFGREYGIPEGESLLTMSVDFRDFTPALAGKSRGTQGDVIKSIDQLWVVVYKTDGTNVLTQKIEDFTENTVRPNERPDGVPSDEISTGHAEFKLRLYNDRYRIYAVANYDLSGMGNPSEEDLKNIKLDWQDDVKMNNAMFGFFTSSDAANPPVSFDAPEVVVRGTGTLHAWVRRAVSKLTIVYDGSGLKDGVFVYIKSARIKDMASDCLLGAPNDYNRIKAGYRLVDGDTIKYYPGDVEPADDASAYGPEYKYRVTCGGDVVGSHAEDANSLFFFENIQESGKEGTVTDKRQDTSGENKQVSWPGGRFENNEAWKDGRPYGTYVEVKGYYISIADGHMSSGPITYRFMLGKNVVDDYSAERNYHYKLTMMFKGYANDVDFHIDYTVLSPDGHVPPYYISYLYNHTAYHPVSVSTGKRRLTKVLCEIEENHWWPNDAQPKDAASGIVGVYNPAGVADPRSWQWHGFLSLRKTKDAVLTGNSNENTVTGSNARYYFDHLRHSREYSDMSEGWHVDD
ncbi:MAG: hypothetical protein K2O12_01950, partial [Muribaculaceae bacterium]|nr:hypothetical protein [Muribaculaceae bacterium]